MDKIAAHLRENNVFFVYCKHKFVKKCCRLIFVHHNLSKVGLIDQLWKGGCPCIGIFSWSWLTISKNPAANENQGPVPTYKEMSQKYRMQNPRKVQAQITSDFSDAHSSTTTVCAPV